MAGKKKKSTTRSGTNLESLSLYTFFLDRALQSYALRDALKDLGARVQMHRDHFEEDAEDIDWLPIVARREWVILTKDQYNWLERQAIRTIIRKALPQMLRILDLTAAPVIAKIHRDGSVLITNEMSVHTRKSR